MEHLANIWNLIEISFVRGKWLKFRYIAIARDSCLSPHILIRKGKNCFTTPAKTISHSSWLLRDPCIQYKTVSFANAQTYRLS